MKPGLDQESTVEITFTVTQDMCPHFDGVLVHRLLSTWEMVHHMEVAGRKLISPHLEDHEEAVGAGISVEHRTPAPLGSWVMVRATAETVAPRRLVARVEAFCDGRVVGEGRFVQVVVTKTKLLSLIEKYQSGESPPLG